MSDGLTRTQLSLLGTVSRLCAARASDLAEIEGLNPTMLSRMIGKLETADWLVRAADPADGRAILVQLTKVGARKLARIRSRRTALLQDTLGKLDEPARSDLQTAIPALEDLADQLATPDRVTPLPKPTER
jgi:DNA-binding MarR family transcriptional regulator